MVISGHACNKTDVEILHLGKLTLPFLSSDLVIDEVKRRRYFHVPPDDFIVFRLQVRI